MAGLQGRVFGGYQLAEQLSSAGMAEVYRAKPAKPGGREAVVKVIHPEFARMPGLLPRFREIVQATSKVSSHPHVLPLLASGEESGYLYLITPYVAAGTLKDWIGRGGRMGPGDVAPFFRQLCDALTYAHSLGVVHGNVKPSNVFLFEGRHVLLGDFGLLFDVAHLDMDHAGSGVEVVEYLAPEVIQGPPTQQSDIYSVGAVLYAAVIGQPPFRGARPSDIFNAHARQPAPRLAQTQAGLSPVMQALDAVVQRAMAKQPAQRYPSAAAVGQAVEATIRQAGGGQLSQPQIGAAHPFANSPGAAQPFAPSAAQPGAPGGFTALAPGQLGFGALLAGDAGPRALGALAEGVSPSIRPLGPQFPPLPASALVDESMEQGRVTVRSPDQNSPLAPQSQDGGVPLLPTMRMPASAADVGSLAGEATMRVAAPEPALTLQAGDAAASPPDAGAPQGRGGRGLFSLARKRSGLGKRLGQGAASLPPAIDAAGDGEPAAQALPAIRPAKQPADQGFAVAGGTDPRRAAAGDGDDGPLDAGGFGPGTPWGAAPVDGARSGALPAGDWSAGLAGEQSNVFDLGGASGALPAWDVEQQRGPLPGQDAGPDGFSATALGLPRLTSGGGASSTWQEMISGPMPAVRPPGRDGQAPEEPESSLPHAAWRSSSDLGGEHEWGEDSAEWASPNAGPIAWSGDSAPMPAPRAMGADPWAAVEAPIGPIRVPNEQPRANRPAPEDDIELDYDNPKARRRRRNEFRRRPRWIRPALTLLLLLTLLDAAALVVLRPDLCPNATCRSIGARARSYLPFLNTPAPQPPSDLTTDPASVKVSAVAGKTATAQIKVTNNTSAIVAWKAAAGLPWITLTPADGALPAQSGASLIATVNAAGVKAGAYSTTITITYGQQTITIPVSIDVAAS